MTDAEIAGYMDWRGPGAYTNRQMVRIRRIVEEVQRREREACAELCERMARRINSLDIRTAALEMAAENIRARGQG